ncbi:MAG: aspartate-semialdehyde dehydrogenase [Candidatus Aminicenantes bacterium]|nr:aspartate-semialdehyde dehydrogenase [Candidatus Aminicenantes bacterium]
MKKIKAAILGCNGLVGRQFARLLDDHPYFALSCLTASPRSSGKRFGESVAGGRPPAISKKTASLVIRETTVAAIIKSGARIVFSALPAAVSGDLELELRRKGMFIFTNASSHRMEATVPLLIPEVNAAHLELVREQRRHHPGFIVTNSNCVVAGLALALKPLTVFGVQAVTVTTFQAISGAGQRGVAAWDIMGNVIPYIAHEEEKVSRETKKILGLLTGRRITDHGMEIYPSCSRVAVPEGHLQSVNVEFSSLVSEGDIAAAWTGFSAEPQHLKLPTAPRQPIVVSGAADRPQPALDADAGEPARARGMAVTVGRLRSHGRRCSFFLLVHNTVRGAAGGCLLNAELTLKKKLLGG